MNKKIKLDKRVFTIPLILDVGIALFITLENNYIWFINTQVAFISSFFIMLATYISYKNNIQKRVQNYDLSFNDRDNIDELDKIDDPYELYDNNDDKIDNINIKEVINEEKKALKKDNIKNMVQSFGAFSSIYRIFGYLFLILGFFYLKNNQFLDVISYFVGFSIAPIGILIAILVVKK